MALRHHVELGRRFAAEDTRRVRNLAQALGIEIRGQVVSNFDHNEDQRSHQLIDAARTGTVLVVTDAGMRWSLIRGIRLWWQLPKRACP